uniref:Uncharacterized protein n=1 Tax=uncultured Fidelibacterota bacterium HF0010_18O13 TaxID=710789 RepID=E0XR98_9BACT|nr:hypothetical protein [uncultured Marinimicrobia bacterium HF0010_18O13]
MLYSGNLGFSVTQNFTVFIATHASILTSISSSCPHGSTFNG